MDIPIGPVLYHFWSSALVGLLVWVLMSSTSTSDSPGDRAGSTSSTYWSQLRLPLLSSVWTHIVADVIEHDELPRVVNGTQKLVEFLIDQAGLVVVAPV